MGSGAAEAGAVRYEVEASRSRAITWQGADKDAPWWCWCGDWDGLNGYEIKRAEMLVALGYSVFAVDLFGCRGQAEHGGETRSASPGPSIRTGPGCAPCCRGDWRRRAGRGRLDNAVALGYCFGGAAVLEAGPQRGGISRGGERTRRAGDPGRAGLQRGEGTVACPARQRRRGRSLGQFAALVAELESAGVKHEATS